MVCRITRNANARTVRDPDNEKAMEKPPEQAACLDNHRHYWSGDSPASCSFCEGYGIHAIARSVLRISRRRNIALSRLGGTRQAAAFRPPLEGGRSTAAAVTVPDALSHGDFVRDGDGSKGGTGQALEIRIA